MTTMNWLAEEMRKLSKDPRIMGSRKGVVTRIFCYTDPFKSFEHPAIFHDLIGDQQKVQLQLISMRAFIEEKVKEGALGLIVVAEVLLSESDIAPNNPEHERKVLIIHGSCPEGESAILFDIIRDENGDVLRYDENPELQNKTVTSHLFDNLRWQHAVKDTPE